MPGEQRAPRMVSYAQNREDVVLARAFEGSTAGFYIDVGASDPEYDSVTKHFYDLGWRGINVEPALVAFEALEAARPRDINLGLALGESEGDITFYELPRQMTGCSTVSPAIAAAYERDGWTIEERRIPVTTLSALCAEHAAEMTIDFLKIDVEGAERDVLAGADFERFRPRVLVVEATEPGTPEPSFDSWESILIAASYELVLADGLNRFFVRAEDAEELRDRLAVPANYFDAFVTREEADLERRLASASQEAAGQAVIADRARLEVREQARLRAAIEEALGETRGRLAKSQAGLRDARTELGATRNALTAAIAKHSA